MAFQFLLCFYNEKENLGLFSWAPIPQCSLSLSSTGPFHVLFSLGELGEAAIVVTSWGWIISLVMKPQSQERTLAKWGEGVLTSLKKPKGWRWHVIFCRFSFSSQETWESWLPGKSGPYTGSITVGASYESKEKKKTWERGEEINLNGMCSDPLPDLSF